MSGILGAVLLLAVAAAEAPPPTPAPAPAAPPARPDMAFYYPERASRLELEGRVELSCQVQADGSVNACEVISESPPGFGFGAAALKMTGRFRMKTTTEEGKSVVGSPVRIPVAFKPPEDFDRPLAVYAARWKYAPGAGLIDTRYPGRARYERVEGQATLRCTVAASLGLEKCEVVAETPAGYDFGRAAARLAFAFTARPVAEGGPAVGEVVDIPVAFTLPPLPSAEAVAQAVRCSGLLAARQQEKPDKPDPAIVRAAAVAHFTADTMTRAVKTPEAEVTRLREEGRADQSRDAFKACMKAYR